MADEPLGAEVVLATPNTFCPLIAEAIVVEVPLAGGDGLAPRQ
jgi:hypothetical protein